MQSRMSCIQKKNKTKPTKEPKTKQKKSNKKIPYSLEYTTWLKKKKKKG